MPSPSPSSGDDPQLSRGAAPAGPAQPFAQANAPAPRPTQTDGPPTIDLRGDPAGNPPPAAPVTSGGARGTGRRATTLATVAVVLSVAAVALAGAAFVRAGGSATSSTSVAVAAAPSTTGSTGSSAVTPTGGQASADQSSAGSDGSASGNAAQQTGVPLPTVGYTQAYQDQRLLLTPNSASSCVRYIDLDRPAVVADEQQADVTFKFCGSSNGSQLVFPSVEVATVTSASATPEDCAAAIQQAPSSQEITLSRQLVICTTTDGVSTPDQPARRKVVRLLVNSVEKDGTADITANSWLIPG